MCDPTGGVATAAVVTSTAAASTTAAAATTAAVTAAAASTAAASAAAAAGTLTFTAAATGAATSAFTLGNLALGASLLSGAVGAYGAYQQGQSGKAMNEYQSKVLQQQQVLNQRNADANSTIVANQGAAESKAVARKTAITMGAQAAAAAANGTAGSVSANDIRVDTFDTGHLDQLAVQYNADLKNWGIQNGLQGEQWRLGVESNEYNMAGANAEKAGFINSGASLIGSAAQVANNRLLLRSRGSGIY